MRKILLRDADLVKNTAIGGNVDTDRYKHCIRDAQVSVLEEALGEDLYNVINNLFTPTAEFPAGVYKILYDDYINPYLIRAAAVEYLIISSFDIGNNGNVIRQPDGTIATTEDQVARIINAYRHKARMYRERLERYLRKNKTTIPEYKYNPDNIVNPTTEKGGTGWYF